ncbi:feMo cofactor biosynthesis protein NifB [bacterium BMS3Abin07]|nr:feMo cofactor biosynthesis protein NifB [bacterium BMS3Abin07]GBE31724.1 feMo cofactor biosynthesis protein NifB [bacterium BMS3Bbin05]HDL21342.1 nitrogenase cofactor biosynthesis protein NifB [Nitrospirota bacterium]HDO23345.1 nitrogenase cofactor biosynthesis protein NifB [Nitrospirota bacterium]HDZ87421.1 nitrogenase cofactor biosynthesis protein NifB [Nitrospirota bacterium]
MEKKRAIRKYSDAMNNHPCFNEDAHGKFGRIHLPVAPACNIQCKYCIRDYDCANESRPGVSSRILTIEDAVNRVRTMVDRNYNLSVVGIAGPGDPLANNRTFDVLRAVRREFPELVLCLSTNGLLLTDRLEEIVRIGVRSITITINAVVPEAAERIYSWVYYRGVRYHGRAAADCLSFNQWRGLRNAVDAGLVVKVNSVYIPGMNDKEIPYIAWLAGRRGAEIHNIIPLIPQGEFGHLKRPSREMIHTMREQCSEHIPQMTHCMQCRADACGIVGEDKDIELELLNARIGEDYCEMVN